MNSPIGKLGIKIKNEEITNISFDLQKREWDLTPVSSSLQKNINTQLQEYFLNSKHKFTC